MDAPLEVWMKLSRWSLSLAVLLVFALAGPGHARAPRIAQVPNGLSVSCSLCHVGFNYPVRTVFGQQVEEYLEGTPLSNARINWLDIYDLDADGDGATNGDELGDPKGLWAPGDPDPGVVSDPSDRLSLPPGGVGGEGGAGGAGGAGGEGGEGGADEPDGSVSGAGGGDDGGGGSGCQAGTAPGAGSALLLLLGAVGRGRVRRES